MMAIKYDSADGFPNYSGRMTPEDIVRERGGGMSEMVERVARAIDDACPCDMTVCMGPDAARTMAAAAIAAMREPTQAMCEAGDIIPPAPGEIAWPRMIDAALESVEAA